MNQILNTNPKKNKMKKIFKIQFVISLALIIAGIIYLIRNLQEKERENRISKVISLNAKLNSVFSSEVKEEVAVYFGRIICNKIGLDNYIYNQYSAENLKVLPCKFSGGNLEENSNICIIGHNYFDNRFFSNLNKLEIGDTIIIKDLQEKEYKYKVYKIYEIDEKDTEQVTKQQEEQELTLCTCTYSKEKRLIVKAKSLNI